MPSKQKQNKIEKRVVYYKDEKNDDFLNTKTSLKVTVDAGYNYLPKNVFFRFFSFVLYYCFALPILGGISLFCHGLRVNNKKALKQLKKTGYVIFCNHSHYSDAWLGQVSICLPKRAYIISNKNAIQIPVVNVLTKLLGCLPVADTMIALKNLNNAVSTLLNKKKAIVVFPEAHVWPYYTGLRQFSATSFRFASCNKVPAVPVAVPYKKRTLFGKIRKPAKIVHIGQPILYDHNLTEKQNRTIMHQKTVEFIKSKVNSPDNFAYIEYVKAEQN